MHFACTVIELYSLYFNVIDVIIVIMCLLYFMYIYIYILLVLYAAVMVDDKLAL